MNGAAKVERDSAWQSEGIALRQVPANRYVLPVSRAVLREPTFDEVLRPGSDLRRAVLYSLSGGVLAVAFGMFGCATAQASLMPLDVDGVSHAQSDAPVSPDPVNQHDAPRTGGGPPPGAPSVDGSQPDGGVAKPDDGGPSDGGSQPGGVTQPAKAVPEAAASPPAQSVGSEGVVASGDRSPEVKASEAHAQVEREHAAPAPVLKQSVGSEGDAASGDRSPEVKASEAHAQVEREHAAPAPVLKQSVGSEGDAASGDRSPEVKASEAHVQVEREKAARDAAVPASGDGGQAAASARKMNVDPGGNRVTGDTVREWKQVSDQSKRELQAAQVQADGDGGRRAASERKANVDAYGNPVRDVSEQLWLAEQQQAREEQAARDQENQRLESKVSEDEKSTGKRVEGLGGNLAKVTDLKTGEIKLNGYTLDQNSPPVDELVSKLKAHEAATPFLCNSEVSRCNDARETETIQKIIDLCRGGLFSAPEMQCSNNFERELVATLVSGSQPKPDEVEKRLREAALVDAVGNVGALRGGNLAGARTARGTPKMPNEAEPVSGPSARSVPEVVPGRAPAAPESVPGAEAPAAQPNMGRAMVPSPGAAELPNISNSGRGGSKVPGEVEPALGPLVRTVPKVAPGRVSESVPGVEAAPRAEPQGTNVQRETSPQRYGPGSAHSGEFTSGANKNPYTDVPPQPQKPPLVKPLGKKAQQAKGDDRPPAGPELLPLWQQHAPNLIDETTGRAAAKAAQQAGYPPLPLTLKGRSYGPEPITGARTAQPKSMGELRGANDVLSRVDKEGNFPPTPKSKAQKAAYIAAQVAAGYKHGSEPLRRHGPGAAHFDEIASGAHKNPDTNVPKAPSPGQAVAPLAVRPTPAAEVPTMGSAGRSTAGRGAEEAVPSKAPAVEVNEAPDTAKSPENGEIPSRSAAREVGSENAPPPVADRCTPNSFLPGTLVLMADGSRKRIEDVRIGDKVAASDPETGASGARSVTGLITGIGQKDLVEVTVDTDGDAGDRTGMVVATGGHPFWDNGQRRWVDAQDLSPGEQLQAPDGRTFVVTAAKHNKAFSKVYNLDINDVNTYFVLAGDVPLLVHNHDVCVVALDEHGKELMNYDVSSGNQTPAEKALGGGFNSQWSSHTEARVVRIHGSVTNPPIVDDEYYNAARLGAGDTVLIEGQASPCPRCQGAMNLAQRARGTKYYYVWPDGLGGYNVWRPGVRRFW
jgi:pretoxin HINT domain-containing protein/nucleic acid/nucleotide deaminase of polymorphic system toxin